MKATHKAIVDDNGGIVWLDGKVPTPKQIGVVSFIGWERADYVRDYEARPDKHPSGEDNIRYCELKTQSSRDDVRPQPRKKRFY
jgi:hypothetical protein